MNAKCVVWFLRVVVLLCVPTAIQAQSSAASAGGAAEFGAEPYVVKSAATVFTREADGTGTDVQTFSVVIHSDAALRQFSVVGLSYASQSQQAEFVYARVVHPDGSTQETPVGGAIEQAAPVTQQAPLYSDLKVKQLPIKSLRAGDTVEWQTRVTTAHPEAPGQFWGQGTFLHGGVVQSETVELRVPASIHVTVWTNPRSKVMPEEASEGAQHVYRWRHADLQTTVGAAAEAFKNAEEKRLRTPEEEQDLLKGELPSVAFTTFPDWAAVGAWYRSLEADRTAPDAAIKAKVAELTAGKKGELEQAQAVYQYVSTQIRYVGVDFGIGRYQPHTAAEVFSNQYGDCKDKHTLLAAMLSVLNLHADPVLVGAGIRFNPAVPSPAAFNHVISRLELDGHEAVWLDATAEIGAWGALLYPLRDHEALVVPREGAASVARTPRDLPFAQYADFTVKGSLDGDLTSDSEVTYSLRSDAELYVRAVLHSVSPASYGEFVQNFMGGMGFGGTTSNASIENLNDPSQPLKVSFHYHRVKEKDWGENRVTAAFQPIGLPYFSADKPPVSSIQIGSPRTETSTVEMQLPKDWSAELPAEVHQHTEFANCDVTYKLENGKLIAHRTLVVFSKQVPVADSKKYQTWFDESDAGTVPYIQLYPRPKEVKTATAEVPKAPDFTASGGAGDRENPQAAEFVQKGLEAIRNMDLDTARSNFDQANKINPTQRGLWAGYAGISQMLGATSESVANAQHELSYHPDEVQFYRPVVAFQLQMGDTSGALATLNAWVKAAPDTPDAALALTTQLAAMKRHAEVVKVADTAILRLKEKGADTTDLVIARATAQAALQHSREAADSVAPLLATETNPVRINHVNYVLAEAHSHLADAESAQAKAIASSESETADWTATGNLRPYFAKEVMIAQAWDTMGYILYQEGKYAEALPYLKAAVRAIDDAEAHRHLALAATALHRPALAAQPDLKLRTLALGPANGLNGVVNVNILIVDGKVVDTVMPQGAGSATELAQAGPNLLKKADLRELIPPGSKAHLVRSTFLNCHSNICELVLTPLK